MTSEYCGRPKETEGNTLNSRALTSWLRRFFLAFTLSKSWAKAAQKPVALYLQCHKNSVIYLLCILQHIYGKSYFSGTRVLCIRVHSHRCRPLGSRIPRSHSYRRWSSLVPSGPGCRYCHSGCLENRKVHIRFHTAYSAHRSKKCMGGLTPHSTSQSKQGNLKKK